MGSIIDSHLHVWDSTAAGKDPGPVRIGYSPQAQAPVELFMDYMDEAGVEKAVFVQPWFYHWDHCCPNVIRKDSTGYRYRSPQQRHGVA